MIPDYIPRVITVNDLSGFCRVSLTESISILSAMGNEVCPLPTAVLSTHTYHFRDYTFCDLTDEMPKILENWQLAGIKTVEEAEESLASFKSKQNMSSFDTDDFFEAALKRSNERIKERSKK